MVHVRPKKTESSSRKLLAQLQRAMLPILILSALPKLAEAATSSADPATAGGAVSFDNDFFPAGSGQKADLSRFEKADTVFPGTYLGDIVVNKVWRARGDINFVDQPGLDSAQPCFDAAMLTSYGLDLHAVAADTTVPSRKPIPEKGRFCGPIGDYVPGATSTFDSGEQSLSLQVPQIYMRQTARGYVDPSQWDGGINAGVLNYNANVYRSGGSSRGGDQTSAYVGINASLKFGSWHLYHLGSLSWSQHLGRHYQNASTYLQHDIPSMRAQLVAGDVFTTGQLFDSVRLRGVRLYSDVRMLPQSQRGYAPVIRGVADTNARVVIKQHGYTLKEITVAPGPFAVDDLYPTGYGGDIEVEVIEADGRVKRFSVPFAATPQLLRAGLSNWDIAAGEVSDMNLSYKPTVLQGTYQYGLNNTVTAYGGTTLASAYRSLLVGAAVNTRVGAFSLDNTLAATRIQEGNAVRGMSARLAYSKNITDTGTNFSVAAMRFSSSGYLGLNDAVYAIDNAKRGNTQTLARERNRLDLTLSQTLGNNDKYGQIYLTGSRSNYWGSRGNQVNFSAGYSNHWKSFNYSISAQRTRETLQDTILPDAGVVSGFPVANYIDGPALRNSSRRDTQILLTVSVPLGTAPRAPLFTGLVNHANSLGGTNSQATISGSATEDGRLSYNATLGHDDVGGTSGGVSGQYNSPLTDLTASYSRGRGYNQASGGISGSLIAHSGGVTFSPPAGETVALIHAPDATGARVANGQGSTIDSRGYGVMPYLTPYELNTVGIDPAGAALNVEFKETTQNVAPRAGSVVLLQFKTTSGRALLVDTTLPDGRPVPFGAEVFDAQGKSVGVVGQASRLFVNNMPQSGVLTVRWGEGADQSCRIRVELPPLAKGSKSNGQEQVQAQCGWQGANTELLPKEVNVSSGGLRATKDLHMKDARAPVTALGATAPDRPARAPAVYPIGAEQP